MKSAVTRLSLLLSVLVFGAAAVHGQETSCTRCHSDANWFEDTRVVDLFQNDVHAQAGLSCHDCHGGNPDPAMSEDMLAAMDESYAANPYRAAPVAGEIPNHCGRCHSDSAYMRRFNPGARTDQEKEYWTSVHGMRVTQGDLSAATCTDCHGSHGVRRADDPQSSIYPTKVAQTCSRCHSDAGRMAGYELPSSEPLPTNQYGEWARSVHGQAMMVRGDLSAPTCNDCHGNHGAAPPGIDSVANVCGQCHAREAELFRSSVKHTGLQNHNELFLSDKSTDCTGCHFDPEPPADLAGLTHLNECGACHGNHAVLEPTIAMFAPLPATPCALCHEPKMAPAVPEPIRVQRAYERRRNALMEQASLIGIEDEERFNWLVDQALALPEHSAREPGQDTALGSEFASLFKRFRIGKTRVSYEDPQSGDSTQIAVTRCSDCHAEDPDSIAWSMSSRYLESLSNLAALTGRADRLLLSARRGGVEVKDGMLELDKAVDAHIQLVALLHGFSLAEDGAFLEKHADGLERADAALLAGQSAHAELQARRTGLVVALLVIFAVLVALGLKIRHTSVSATLRAADE